MRRVISNSKQFIKWFIVWLNIKLAGRIFDVERHRAYCCMSLHSIKTKLQFFSLLSVKLCEIKWTIKHSSCHVCIIFYQMPVRSWKNCRQFIISNFFINFFHFITSLPLKSDASTCHISRLPLFILKCLLLY